MAQQIYGTSYTRHVEYNSIYGMSDTQHVEYMAPQTHGMSNISHIRHMAWWILYSGYISRAFNFGEFGELTKFAKIKPRQTPTLYSLYTIQYIELYRVQKPPN